MNGNLTAKTYLRQYLDAERTVKIKLEEIRRLEEILTQTTQALGGTPVQSSPSDNMGIGIARLIDARNEANEAIDKMVDLKNDIKSVISNLPDKKMSDLLYERYILGKTFEQIAMDMNYTYRNICYLHGKALKLLHFT